VVREVLHIFTSFRKGTMAMRAGNVAMALAVCLVVTSESTGAWHVWTVTETRRLLRADPPQKRLAVKLAGAKNEWESFQILMRSDVPVNGIALVPGDLVGPDGTVLPASQTRIYRQHQLELTHGTYRNEEFRPGWYPDPLIPLRHPLTRRPLEGGRFVAVPFDLPPEQTHGFWVDLYVPTDAPAGRYRGTYRVTAAGRQTAEIPVQLVVWDFALPRVSTFRTALGSPAARMRSYYRRRAQAGKEPEPEDWAEVDEQCAELLSRHRVNATPPPGSLAPEEQPDGSFRIPDEQIEAFRRFVDRYHVNAFRVPHPRSVVRDPVAQAERLARWLAAWDRAAERLDRPQVIFYTYLKDEPNDEEAYRYVQTWGRAIRQCRSVLKVLVVEQTWPQNDDWGDLCGAVDIWCPLFPLFRAESAAKRQALGETVWTYTALCQREPTPWWHIDFPLLNYRVPAWIAWRYRIQGILYWGGMSYWQGVEDPWTDPKTLDRRRGRPQPLYNGEGTLVYPGRAVGYEGIAPSLRLKALRDAIEDYEYLAILERHGLADQAQQLILPLATSWFQWEKDPSAYEKTRRRLAELILRSER